ncbi:MAG: aldo/keto reductase, partial [Acetobacteraceae bacterium]
PYHATTAGTKQACEQSLKRLRTDRIDLYLLHWPGSVPLEETIAGFETLRSAGKIRHWGVSNFDVADMEKLLKVPSGSAAATNQVLYNLETRGIEFDLLPWSSSRAMPVMAYTPFGAGGRLLRSPALNAIAERHGATPAQVALAFLLQRSDVIVIPKAATQGHVQTNAAAASLRLEAADLEALDAAHPPPRKKMPLAML